MRTGTVIFGAALAALSQPGAAQLRGARTPSGCLDVAQVNARVEASGRLTEIIFTDPLGTERAFILLLPDADCLEDGGEVTDGAERFTQVHVFGTSNNLQRALRSAMGRDVSVQGEGFAAHTRHHRRPLVIAADEVTVR